MKKQIILAGFVLLCFSLIFAETIEEKLQKFGTDGAKGYIQPLVNTMGANLNTGFYNSAKVLKPFRPQLTFNIMLTPIPSKGKKFILNRPDTIYAEPYLETSTIFGDETGNTFHGNTYYTQQVTDITLPGGVNTDVMPLVIPQLALGLPFGNEIQLRYLPKYKVNDDFGNIEFFGIGLKHSVSQYLPLFPVDIAVQGFYQSITLGDILDIKALALNAQVSKKLLFLTLYGGLGWENTTMDAKYTFIQETIDPVSYQSNFTPIPISLSLEAENSVRATAGMRLSLLFLKLYADYSIAAYNTANIGVGVGF